MKIKKYAAIDIGSNAVRILVTSVVSYKKKTVFLKNALVRVPIRLGQDAFTNGNISDMCRRTRRVSVSLCVTCNVSYFLA